MMNILCSPNGGFPMIGLVVAGIAALIWTTIDSRFSKVSDNSMNTYYVGKLVIVAVMLVGYIAGGILSLFISFQSFC